MSDDKVGILWHRGHKLTYYKQWDAYWCETCMRWAEGKCSDPACEFCSKRPDYNGMRFL